MKTPDTHPSEFTKKRNGEYEHKKTKWIFTRSKEKHDGERHWHTKPKNAAKNDSYNISNSGKIL